MYLIKVLLLIFLSIAVFAKDGIPSSTQIQKAMKEAYTKFKDNKEGKNADYIKALADVPSNLFGISVVTADGKIYEIGDTKYKFSIQSISKVFTASLVMKQRGYKALQKKIGVNATGLPFNSIIALELEPNRPTNPFVNAGAIATTSLVKAKNSKERWKLIKTNMSAYAGHQLELNKAVYKSEVNDNKRNQAISKILEAYGRIYSNPLEATTVYTKQCSMNVTAKDLAVMGASLANYGVNPLTHKRVLDKKSVPHLLAVMATAGLYDSAGDWLWKTGTPAKSGVGGGILAVVPGKLAIGVFAPPLDKIGNSVKGQKAAAYIIKKLHLNPFDPRGVE